MGWEWGDVASLGTFGNVGSHFELSHFGWGLSLLLASRGKWSGCGGKHPRTQDSTKNQESSSPKLPSAEVEKPAPLDPVRTKPLLGS